MQNVKIPPKLLLCTCNVPPYLLCIIFVYIISVKILIMLQSERVGQRQLQASPDTTSRDMWGIAVVTPGITYNVGTKMRPGKGNSKHC